MKQIGDAPANPLGDMPDPTPEQLVSPEFEAIWQTIKSWDVNVPEFYNGYCGANGSHVVLILEALAALRPQMIDAAAAAWPLPGPPIGDDWEAHQLWRRECAALVLTAAFSAPLTDQRKDDR